MAQKAERLEFITFTTLNRKIPNDLEEAAEKSLRLAGFHNMETRGMDWKGGFIAGAKWAAEHLKKQGKENN